MLDVHTLHTIMALCQFMMGIFLFILWRDNRGEHALAIWAATNLFCCVTTYMFVLQGQLNPFLTVVVPAWGVSGFVIGYWVGLRKLLDMPQNLSLLLSALVLQTAIVSYFALVEPVLWVRFVTNAAVTSTICFFLCADILKTLKHSKFFAFKLFMGVFAIHGSVFAVAGIGALFTRPMGGYDTLKTGSTGIAVLEGLLMFFLASICVAVLIPEKLQARLKRSSITDALSGLFNRAYFMEKLGTDLRNDGDIAVMYLDLDGFKEVNDQHGHHMGDLLLMAVAKIIAEAGGHGTTVARMGGDEFSIIVRGKRALERAQDKASTIIGRLSQPLNLRSINVLVNTSIGIAPLTQEGENAIELVRRADIAMYAAKKGGRGQYTVYSDSLDDALAETNWLKMELRKAIDADAINVVYQPKYAVAPGKAPRLVAVEALARWEHPDRGMISPADFIPVAEQSGLIVELGRRVLEIACHVGAQWDGIEICVNLSPRQFSHPDLVDDILGIARSANLPTHLLELEVTEGLLLSAGPHVVSVINDLQNEGVKLAVDDFGTGYASFSYLRDYKFDTLKIDRSFVAAMQESQQAMAVTQAVVNLAHALDLKVTAEGVESQLQLDLMMAMGCDLIQGYYLGRPMPARNITALLEDGQALEQADDVTLAQIERRLGAA